MTDTNYAARWNAYLSKNACPEVPLYMEPRIVEAMTNPGIALVRTLRQIKARFG
jgi:hypothetical protein